MLSIKPKPKPQKRAVISAASIQAPTGGLNAKDAIANMKESEAVIMTNWFPTPSYVAVRNGYDEHATGLGDPVESLLSYNIGATQKLFGIAGGDIYDVSGGGAVGAPVVTGLSNSRFQSVTIGTSGGFFLLAVNGTDDMQYYDGTTWAVINSGTTPSITGVATSDIIHINNFKNRIWLIEKNKLKAWYLPVSSIGGAAAALDLSALFKFGGYLMAMANWTIDNAAGIDDYAAFITSEGEIALYKGTDPSDADAWALVGTFRTGRPIGRRCCIKVAADVLVVTTDGAIPLSKALLTDRTQSVAAVTDKITNLVKSDIISYSGNFGWQPILHPFGNKILINVPTVENSISHQWTMNTENGSWCRFEGWSANCFEVLEDSLYFGGDGIVYQADIGTDDNGADIETDVQQAFSYFKSAGQIKKFTMARPTFLTDGDIDPAIVLNVDFETRVPTSSPSFTMGGDSLWDVSPWDTSSWALGDSIVKKWQSVTGVGYCGGLRIKTVTQNLRVQWVSTDFTYEKGGIL